MTDDRNLPVWHGTTIVTVRRGNTVVVAGDGQVSLSDTVIKGNARKVRPLGKGDVIAGFAGATADAMTLFERLEAKLEQYPGQLTRACVELAKDWRTDRYLRRLEAMMIVADKSTSLVLTGNGDVLEPENGIIAIGSGGNYALSAARALAESRGAFTRSICRPGALRRGGTGASAPPDQRARQACSVTAPPAHPAPGGSGPPYPATLQGQRKHGMLGA